MGNFHYTLNVVATYHNTMIIIFHDMLHDFFGDHVDDIIMKSNDVCYHIDDLRGLDAGSTTYVNPLK